MKYPESKAERAERATRIRHARKLESVLRVAPGGAFHFVVAAAFDDALGTAGTTVANNLLRARVMRYAR